MISREPILVSNGDEIDVVAIVRLMWRYRYLIAAIGVLCGSIAVLLALSTTPIYRAEVVVTEVHDGNVSGGSSLMSQLGGLASIAGINLAGGGADIEAQAVLQSRRLAAEFVQRNALLAELLPDAANSSLWFAVNAFRDTVLSIVEEEDSGTTRIMIQWTDPVVAARWANDFIALANEIIRTRALNDSSRNIKYLNEQIAKTDIVEIQRVMYRLIETETKTLMLANARDEYAFTVVDPAVPPEQRIWPKRTLIVLTGCVIGAFIGVILAFAHNLWSRHRT